MQKMIWSGSGELPFGDYSETEGTPEMGYLINLGFVGCGNRELSLNPTTESTQVRSSCDGVGGVIDEFPHSAALEVSLVMEQFSAREMAMAMFSQAVLIEAGTVTGEVLPTLKPGDLFTLKYPHATDVVVQDAASGTPVTYTEGVHYAPVSAGHATYRFIAHPDPGSPALPLSVDYSYGESVNLAVLSQPLVERGLMFFGRNPRGQMTRITIPRVSWRAASAFNWLSAPGEVAQLQLTGTVLKVGAQLSNDPLFGRYARIDALPA